jgi:hypothetical protein
MHCHRYQTCRDGAKRGMTSVVLLKALLLGAISLNLLACATSPYRWTQLTQANFPAPVNQLITEYGNLLDQRHRSGYGEWDVSTTSEPPTATYACTPGEMCHIVVSRLHCTNAHSEKTDCAVRLDIDKKVCRLLLSERKQALSIRCPLDVVLIREKAGPGNIAIPPHSKHTTAVQF